MFAPLNGAPLNGGATDEGSWANGVAAAEAVAEAAAAAHVFMVGEAVAGAEAPASAHNEAWPTLEIADAEATSDAEPTHLPAVYADAVLEAEAEAQLTITRLAYLDGEATTEAASDGVLERHAYVNASDPAEAGSDAVSLNITPADPAPADAEASASVDDATVEIDIFMVPSTMRARAQTWMSEGLIERIEVNQRWSTGTTIARSRSRALPNTKIGFSLIEGWAESVHDPAAMRRYRDHYGSHAAEADMVSDPGRIRVIEGNPIGEAFTVLAPTIEDGDGNRTSYFIATAEAEASTQAEPFNFTWINIEPTAASAEVDGDYARIREMQGDMLAEASLQAANDVNVNTWHRAAATDHAAAECQGEAIRYRWRGMEASNEAIAELPAVTNRVERPMVGEAAQGQASLVGLEPLRTAWQEAADDGVGSVSIDVTLYRWRYVEGEAGAEAASEANGLRDAWAALEPLRGEAAGVPVVFKINAGDPASPSRTLVIQPSARLLVVPASDREYLVA